MSTATSSCVLLVEDDPLTRERLELLIETAGFGAMSVASASEAREALAAVFFPMIIIDRLLGEEDGIVLCEQVRRASQGKVYVMLLSVLDSPNEIARGLAAGADDYLSKQSSDHELLIHLRAAMRLVRMPFK
jgi:DNA-binding response OmpR family regulator